MFSSITIQIKTAVTVLLAQTSNHCEQVSPGYAQKSPRTVACGAVGSTTSCRALKSGNCLSRNLCSVWFAAECRDIFPEWN